MSSTHLYVNEANCFDNFLYGVALTNHANYLGPNWDPSVNASICQKSVAYVVGMVEHLFFLVVKVLTVVVFLFINLVLTGHYLASYCQSVSEEAVTKRKIRLFVGLLGLGEAASGLGVDLVGVACPPLAYKIHEILKQKVTRRCFEKWGIIDHKMTDNEFAALDFLSKV